MSLFMPCSLRGLLLCFRRTGAADHKPAGVVYLATQHTHFPGCWVRLFPLLPRALYIVFQLSSLARSPAHISFSLLFVFSVCTEGWFAAPQSTPPICDSFPHPCRSWGSPVWRENKPSCKAGIAPGIQRDTVLSRWVLISHTLLPGCYSGSKTSPLPCRSNEANKRDHGYSKLTCMIT